MHSSTYYSLHATFSFGFALLILVVLVARVDWYSSPDFEWFQTAPEVVNRMVPNSTRGCAPLSITIPNETGSPAKPLQSAGRREQRAAKVT